MQIADDNEHQALAYVSAVTAEGHSLTVDEFCAFVSKPPRTAVMAVVSFSDVWGKTETVLRRLERRMWLVSDDESVTLTDLGSAVLRALDKAQIDTSVPLEVILSPEDPFAYARVIDRLASLPTPMLVDRFFKLEFLSHILFYTQVNRLLVGPEADKPGLALATDSLPPDRDFTIRAAPDLHDRFFIPRTGAVEMLGTSLNGVGNRVSTLIAIRAPMADVIRETYESIWDKASPLRKPKGEEAS